MYIDAVAVFLFSACLGSFLNVCIYRLPKEQSLVKPRSFCPHCQKTIKWYDNIPIASYLFLGGRCRNCRKKISLRYPAVELITAVLLSLLYRKFGFSLAWLQFSIFFAILIVVSFIDIDYHAIPAYLCLLGIVVALGFNLAKSFILFRQGQFELPRLPIYTSAMGLIVGLGFTYLFKLFGDVFISVYLALRKKESIEGEKESMGLGDVDFMGMVGAFLGWQTVLFVFFLAPFIAVIYSLSALIFKKSHLIPYLPYLSLATVIVVFWGNQLLQLIF